MAAGAINWNTRRGGGRVPPGKLGRGVRHPSWNPFPISDQNRWFSLPYDRPDPSINQPVTSSPNDEEVASSKKHTQFKIKTRVHKPYPFFRPKWSKLVPYFRPKRVKNHTLRAAHTYIAYIREYSPPPPGLKHHCVIFSKKAWIELFRNL